MHTGQFPACGRTREVRASGSTCRHAHTPRVHGQTLAGIYLPRDTLHRRVETCMPGLFKDVEAAVTTLLRSQAGACSEVAKGGGREGEERGKPPFKAAGPRGGVYTLMSTLVCTCESIYLRRLLYLYRSGLYLHASMARSPFPRFLPSKAIRVFLSIVFFPERKADAVSEKEFSSSPDPLSNPT